MSVDVKQREWIWEFFLKNCKDARLIQELMSALPFPEENLDVKRMLLLRSLSLQVSAGMIDEFTLDILKGLGEHGRVSALTRREEERLVANFTSQEVAKRRKMSEYDFNDYVEAANSSTPHVKDGGIHQRRREFSRDSVPAETGGGTRDFINGRPIVVGIRDWMKGRALPRSVGGGGGGVPVLENLSKGNADSAETPDGTGDRSGNHFFSPNQTRKHCELELAVMLELAVRHLRGDSLDRRSFECALTKYWGDSSDELEGWHGAGVPGIARVREQIKMELRMVRSNPELLDDVVQKYTKARVEDLLTIYLEKAWAATGQTFLERVSADVINGKYKPVNCNGQRARKAAGSSLKDGDAGQQSIGKVDTSEKPWIRASRGQYSRRREKSQKRFANWDLDDGDQAGGDVAKLPTDLKATDGERQRAENAGGGSSEPDGDRGEKDGVNLKTKKLEGGEMRPSLSSEGGFEINARSLRFDASVARVLEFEDPSGRESKDGQHQQQSQDKEDVARADVEATEPEQRLHQTNNTRTDSGGGGDDEAVGSPIRCAPDMAKVLRDSDAIGLSEKKEKSTTDVHGKRMKAKTPGHSNVVDLFKEKETSTTIDDEKKTKEAKGSAQNTDLRCIDPGSPHGVLNKENIVPQSPPKPTDSNATVCFFSPPPWEGSPAVPVADGIAPGTRRKRRQGSSIPTEADAAASRKAECSSHEAVAPTAYSNQSPDTVSTQRNLRRKQRVLDAVVQDSLPKTLLTTSQRPKGSLLERNAAARNTVEWEDDDDDNIEDSPPTSPSASRHVLLPAHPSTERKISPLVGSKTSGIITNAKHARRKPRKWSETEVESLRREVSKYGKGRWKLILEKNLDTFQGRTEVDLKDKWRNLERFEGTRD